MNICLVKVSDIISLFFFKSCDGDIKIKIVRWIITQADTLRLIILHNYTV